MVLTHHILIPLTYEMKQFVSESNINIVAKLWFHMGIYF